MYRHVDGAPLNGAFPVVVQFKARREKEQIMWRAKEKLRETEIVVTEDSQHRLLELMRQEVEKIKKEGLKSPKKIPSSPNKVQKCPPSPSKISKCPPSPKKCPNTSPDKMPSPSYEFFNPSNVSSRYIKLCNSGPENLKKSRPKKICEIK